MGSTIVEKILARAAGLERVTPGQIVTCNIDLTVLPDLSMVFTHTDDEIVKIKDSSRVAIIIDHAVPAPSIRAASGHTRARKFAEQFGIKRLVDIGKHGISHQVIDEQGLALPGQILVSGDSHTCAAGAFNNAARGLGGVETTQIVCTGTTWFKVPPTIRYELVGQLPTFVSGKDLFLHIAGLWGTATNCALEFGGPGLSALPMSDRRTVAAHGAEVGADFSIFEADDICIEHIRSRTSADFVPAEPDPDADYESVRQIDMSGVVSMVGLPDKVASNAVSVAELDDDVKIDQCFIGSCANGQLEDLRVAASILDGRHVAQGTRLIVTPASQGVYLEATKLGLVEKLLTSGAVVTNSTCGACYGGHMGVVGEGEVCLTASTRNFKGRMGSPNARIYMASPATVAASAVTGTITEPTAI